MPPARKRDARCGAPFHAATMATGVAAGHPDCPHQPLVHRTPLPRFAATLRLCAMPITMHGPTMETTRLRLRRWKAHDVTHLAAINADPMVMEHFPRVLSPQETAAMVQRVEQGFEARGFGLWCVEVKSGATCIGFVGLSVPAFEAPFMPCVEVGWRLGRPWWGHGYATEAARASLDFGFCQAGLDEIVSFTVAANVRSRAVMERLGMARNPAEDFDHPNLPKWHAQRRHVLYRLPQARWAAAEA